MGDNFNLCGDALKCDKEKKNEGCKVTITVNCGDKKPYDDKCGCKDKCGCDVNVVINCCD
ncbi:MAG: hypothetical protein AB9835_02595 [Eubacteriales bacterium]